MFPSCWIWPSLDLPEADEDCLETRHFLEHLECQRNPGWGFSGKSWGLTKVFLLRILLSVLMKETVSLKRA